MPWLKASRIIVVQVDKTLHLESSAQECGATASVALLHSVDDPSLPFFASRRVALTVAHVGYDASHTVAVTNAVS